MGIYDNTAVFLAVIQQGSFTKAANYLSYSNGLISRRITELERELGVTLIQRTTRQLKLTPEGELFYKHAVRMKQELDSAITFVQSKLKKPKGEIKISAPTHFGSQYLTPIIMKFLNDFEEIQVNLILTNELRDPIKEGIDLTIRGSGYMKEGVSDSVLQGKLLLKDTIGLYASPEYLIKYGQPTKISDLINHHLISSNNI